jgi:hypothetical protein
VIVLVAGLLWYIRKKGTERSTSPNSAQQRPLVEQPWHEVRGSKPFILPPGSQVSHGRPVMESNEPRRPVSMSPQVCATSNPVHRLQI